MTTRSLLRCGIVVGPLYLAVGLTQALVREGFDLARHPLSVLANGTGGWIQTANFVLSGLMVIAAAVGIRRVLQPRGRATTWFLGAFGASMLLAAIFPADPVDGFPIGTPEGFPTSISTVGLIHFVAGALGFTALALSCLLATLPMWLRHEPSLAALSLLAGIVVLLGFFGPIFGIIPGVTLGIWVGVVVGWAWLAILSVRLYRASPRVSTTSTN